MAWKKWYQRNYLIDPKAQLKIVSLLAGVAIIASILICAIAYERLIKLGVLFNGSGVPIALLPEAFRDMANSLMDRLIAIVLLMVVVFGVLGVLLTHRVAGPIWKLQSELKKILRGEDVHPIHFRKHDEFKELPDLINKLVAGYKKNNQG